MHDNAVKWYPAGSQLCVANCVSLNYLLSNQMLKLSHSHLVQETKHMHSQNCHYDDVI